MPDGGQTTTQSSAEPEPLSLLDQCKRKEEAGMQRTRNWLAMWQESLRYFLSDQLHGKKEHKDWDWVILNYIWPAIMQEMAKLARDYKIITSGREQSDTDAAEAWQGFLQWQWDKGLHRHGMRIEQLRAILDGKIYGYRVSKLYWEPKIKWDAQQRQWLGDLRHRVWNPAEFWASDKEYINDGDCGTVRWVELEYALAQWPDYGESLKASAKTYPEMLSGGGEHIAGQTLTSGTYPLAGTGGIDKGPVSSATNTLLDLVLQSDRYYGGSATTEQDRRYCRISETYLKDYSERQQEEQIPYDAQTLVQTNQIFPVDGGYVDAQGQPVTAENWPSQTNQWVEPIFPTGRYVLRCEDIILNPAEADQIYRFSTWPFIVIPHYLLPHLWQGTDAVTLYRHTQDMINVTVSHLVNNMKQFGDPRIAIETGAQAAPPGKQKRAYKIMRGAGAILRLNRGGLRRFKIIEPVPPSIAAMQLYGLFAQEYKNLVGLQDIAQGKKTAGGITATEAQFLAISANDRIKLQSVFEDEWVRQLASLGSEMSQVYYPVGRFVRVVGEDQLQGIMEITQRLKDVEFDVDIEPGQNLPYDEEKRIQKYVMAYKMLEQPIANPMLPEMLRILGIAGWQKLLKKYGAWQEFVAFEQLLNAVDEGKVAPEDALKMLVQRATQRLMARAAQRPPQQGPNAKETGSENVAIGHKGTR